MKRDSNQSSVCAFVEHHLDEAQAHAQQAQADEIDLETLLERLANQIGRVLDQRDRHQDGHHADRHIDEENPAPRKTVGDPAAERGADDGRDHHAHAVNGHRHALLFAREAFHQDGLRNGLKPPPPAPCRTRKKISSGRFGARPQRNELMVKMTTQPMNSRLRPNSIEQPAGERQHDGVRDQIGSQHPGALVDGGRQAAGDVRRARRWRCWCPAPP